MINAIMCYGLTADNFIITLTVLSSLLAALQLASLIFLMFWKEHENIGNSLKCSFTKIL